MGTGSGSTATGSDAVQFSWTNSDAVSGQMTATLVDTLGPLGRLGSGLAGWPIRRPAAAIRSKCLKCEA